MPYPTVSVIIPLYNRIHLVQETLLSIQTQTYLHWEAVVVDDGSTDGSYERVQKIAVEDARIKPYKRDRMPKGASTCRNIGLQRALGEYIIFLDSDDLLAPTCLERRVAVLDQYLAIDFAVFNILLFREALDDTNILWNIDSEEDDLVRFLRVDAVWQTTCPMYKKASLLNTDGFDEALPFWQDFEFHIRLISRELRYIKCLDNPPDCYNRRHGHVSISQQGFHTEAQQLKKISIYRHIVQQVKDQHLLNNDIRASIALFLFNQARLLIINHQNLSKAIDSWMYAYKIGAISYLYALIGKQHLKYLCHHQRLNMKISVYLFLAKFAAVLLPRRYKRAPNTLCKVKLQNV